MVNYQREIFRMDHECSGLQAQRVEPNRFLSGLADEYTGKAKRKRLFFALSRSNTLPKTVCVDPAGIRYVLNSLFDYALAKADSKGRVGVHVTCEEFGGGRKKMVFLLVYSSLDEDAVVTGGLFDASGSEKSYRDMSEEELQLSLIRRYAQLLGGALCLEGPTDLTRRLSFSLPVDVPEDAGVKPVKEERESIAWL